MCQKETGMYMTENEKNNVDCKALQYFGKAYLKTPRVIATRMTSSCKSERMVGLVHWLLFNFCNYADNYMSIGGKQVFCARGEYITTYRKLAQLAGASISSVRRYVGTLVEESLVEVSQVAGQVCFRVNGYGYFTEPDAAPQEVPADKKKKENVKPLDLGHTPRFDLLNQL